MAPTREFPWFEVRKGDHGEHRMAITTLPDGTWVTADDWAEVVKLAEWFRARDPFECSVDIYWQGQDYVGTLCGGEIYWTDHDRAYPATEGTLHQVGSSGWCWDCFRAGYGFVRHPVTVAEAGGEFLAALPTRHDGPPCAACGGGYMRPAMMAPALGRLHAWSATHPGEDNSALDGGEYALEYVPHGDRCAALGNGPEHQAMRSGKGCAGCGGRCCTGNPEDGGCRCMSLGRERRCA